MSSLICNTFISSLLMGMGLVLVLSKTNSALFLTQPFRSANELTLNNRSLVSVGRFFMTVNMAQSVTMAGILLMQTLFVTC